MNQYYRTAAYVGAAAVVALAAFATKPTAVSSATDSKLNTEFFPDFKDPLEAGSLEVIEYNQDNATVKPFQVTKTGGKWVIPSHSNYPADADRQLAEAATSVVGLKRLSEVTRNRKDYETYGVVEPDLKTLTPSATGVGKRVVIRDKGNKVLAQLIIGKADKDKPELHFVRVPGEDAVYRASLRTEKLSTKFSDWIEKNLLKLSAPDVRQVTLNDYNVDAAEGRLEMRGVSTLTFDNKTSKWNVEKLQQYKGKELKDAPMGADEELNTQKLNDLKTAMSDLKIVGVVRKPAGLSSTLRLDKSLFNNRANLAELSQHGFYPGNGPDKAIQLYSNNGEIKCGLADGTEYLLRFGAIAGRESDDDKEGDAKTAEGKPDETKGSGLNRYLLVTVSFNQDLIPKPDLAPAPAAAAPAAPDKNAPAKPDAPKSGTPAPAADAKKPADSKTPDPATKPESATPKKTTPDSKKSKTKPKEGSVKVDGKRPTNATEELLAFAPPEPSDPFAAQEAKEKAKSEAKADAKPTDEKPADAKPAAKAADAKPAADKPEAKAADAKAPAADSKAAPAKPGDGKPAAGATKAPSDVAAEAIERLNKQRQKDYEDKVTAGQKRVKELNDRFVDWYYIIPDSTYQKVHLTREDIIKPKQAPANKAAPVQPDFDQLKQGLPK